MKKALMFLFTLCMAAVLFVPSATAAEIVSSGTCGENVTWTLDDAGTNSTTAMYGYYADLYFPN